MTAIRALMGSLVGAFLGLVVLIATFLTRPSQIPGAAILLLFAWAATVMFVVPPLFLFLLPAAAVMERLRKTIVERRRFLRLACGLGVLTGMLLLTGLDCCFRINLLRGLPVALIGGVGLGWGAAIVGLPEPIPVGEELPPSPPEFFATDQRRRDRVLFGKELPPVRTSC